MNRHRRIYMIACILTALIIFAGLGVRIAGQENSSPRVPLSEDWSTRHLVFSSPGSFEQATRTRPFLEWYRALSDPRYQFDQIRRAAALRPRPYAGKNEA